MTVTKLIKKPNVENESSQKENILSLNYLRSPRIVKFAEKFMIIIGMAGQTLFYLQAYKIYSLGSAHDISTPGFSFAFFSLCSWFVYGLMIRNTVLILVNAFAAVGAFLTLLAIYWVS